MVKNESDQRRIHSEERQKKRLPGEEDHEAVSEDASMGFGSCMLNDVRFSMLIC